MEQNQQQQTATAQDILSAVAELPQIQPKKYENASLFHRALAYCIDIFIISPFYSFFFFLLTTTPVPEEERAVVTLFVGATIALLVIVGVGYFVYFEGRGGATFGKRILRIKVVGAEGVDSTIKQAVIRGLLRPIDMILWPIVFFNPKRQRLGDIIAKTWVVKKV